MRVVASSTGENSSRNSAYNNTNTIRPRGSDPRRERCKYAASVFAAHHERFTDLWCTFYHTTWSIGVSVIFALPWLVHITCSIWLLKIDNRRAFERQQQQRRRNVSAVYAPIYDLTAPTHAHHACWSSAR